MIALNAEFADQLAVTNHVAQTSKSIGLSAVLWASLLTSCAANVTPAPVERTTGRSVQLGTEAAAAVGDVIYSEFDYMATGGAVMLEPVSRTIGLGGSVQVPSGAQLVSTTVDGKPGYCTTTLTYSDPLVGPSRSTCYLDSNGDNLFETLWAAPGTMGFTYDLQPPVKYRTGQITSGANGYKNELLYQGLDGNTLRIGYREYVDNLARPAFAQELTYPTNPSGSSVTFGAHAWQRR
jgi:hypothetical protein